MISIFPLDNPAIPGVLIYLSPSTRIGEPRFSVTPTLDNDVVVDHRGFSHGDRDIRIVGKISKTQEDNLWNIMENETEIGIACEDGYYIGMINRLNVNKGILDLNLQIKEKK